MSRESKPHELHIECQINVSFHLIVYVPAESLLWIHNMLSVQQYLDCEGTSPAAWVPGSQRAVQRSSHNRLAVGSEGAAIYRTTVPGKNLRRDIDSQRAALTMITMTTGMNIVSCFKQEHIVDPAIEVDLCHAHSVQTMNHKKN